MTTLKVSHKSITPFQSNFNFKKISSLFISSNNLILNQVRVFSSKDIPEEGQIKLESSDLPIKSSWIDDFVGITDVKHALNKAKEAETLYAKTRFEERDLSIEVGHNNEKLFKLKEKLNSMNENDFGFTDLVNERIELEASAMYLNSLHKNAVLREGNSFLALSDAVRENFTKEQERLHKMKSRTFLGALFGCLAGILGGAFLNRTILMDSVDHLKNSVKTAEDSEKINLIANLLSDTLPTMERSYQQVTDSLTSLQSTLINKLIEEGSASKMLPQLSADVPQHPSNFDKIDKLKQSVEGVECSIYEMRDQYHLILDSVVFQKTQLAQLIKSIEKILEESDNRINNDLQTKLKVDEMKIQFDGLMELLEAPKIISSLPKKEIQLPKKEIPLPEIGSTIPEHNSSTQINESQKENQTMLRVATLASIAGCFIYYIYNV